MAPVRVISQSGLEESMTSGVHSPGAKLGALLVPGILLCLSHGYGSRAEGAGLPDGIARELGKNADSLGPLTLEWERAKTSDFPVPDVLAKLHYPKTALDVMGASRSRFMWDGGKFYGSFWTHGHVALIPDGKGGFEPDLKRPPEVYHQELSFDGEVLYNGSPAGDQPMITIDPLDKVPDYLATVRMTRQDYLYEAGYILPDYPKDLREKVPASSLILSLISQGAEVARCEEELAGGPRMLFVELQKAGRTYRFRLDPSMGYAVRRREERLESGRLAVAVDCDDFAKLPRSGLWLPRRVEATWHCRPEEPRLVTDKRLVVDSYKVTELRDDPIPESQFALRYEKPGTFVADSRPSGSEKQPGGRVSYRQPADPGDLDEVIQTALGGGASPRSRWSSLRVAVVVHVAILAALAAFLLWRRRAALS
jgi:hypothetical protein